MQYEHSVETDMTVKVQLMAEMKIKSNNPPQEIIILDSDDNVKILKPTSSHFQRGAVQLNLHFCHKLHFYCHISLYAWTVTVVTMLPSYSHVSKLHSVWILYRIVRHWELFDRILELKKHIPLEFFWCNFAISRYRETSSADQKVLRRLQPRQIYCHSCSEFEFYLILYSNCCRHVLKLAASKYEFLDSSKRVSGQKLVSRPIQETKNLFFPHLYHLYMYIPYTVYGIA